MFSAANKWAERPTVYLMRRYVSGVIHSIYLTGMYFMTPCRTPNCRYRPLYHNLSQAGTGLAALLLNNLAELPTEFMDVMFCRITNTMYIVNRHEIMQSLFIYIVIHCILHCVCFHIWLCTWWNLLTCSEGILLHVAVASLIQMKFVLHGLFRLIAPVLKLISNINSLYVLFSKLFPVECQETPLMMN